MDLLPKVFRTEGNIAEFDPSKIYESILRETAMNETDAKHVTELVVRRIISSGIKFLSGPHIREIVCSILSEQHFENERKLYTRIGMPLMDYEEILEKGLTDRLNEQINPEKIHHWAADQIAEEYTHLRILDNEESKAHLYGDIHINGLNYFDSRPFSQLWDPRLILKNGLLPIDNLRGFYKQKPATDLKTALYHLSKWLGMTQSEFYGNQGFKFINIFLAPYVQNTSEDKIIQEIREFLYEINQLPFIIGRNIANTLISSSFSIFEVLKETPAIGPEGKITNTYINYLEESLRLFKALILAFKEFYNINSYSIPKHYLILDIKFLDEIENNISNFWEDPIMVNSLYFMNFCLDSYKDKIIDQITKNNQMNFGVLQNVSLNLPRYAYISGNKDDFLELLTSKINLCSSILLKKFNIIEKRIKSNHLPFSSSTINGDPIFNLENQSLSISLIGLNEAIKYLTNYELHEHLEAVNISKTILKEINTFCSELSKRDNKHYILSENISEKAINRFTKLDLKHFSKNVKKLSNYKNIKYSNSVHYRNGVEVDLLNRVKVQGDFHRFIHNNAVEFVSLSDLKKANMSIKKFIEIFCKNSNLSCIKLYS
ncbi:MAG: anaerobic ribonucleoside-triphosphate reductase [Candidatus Hodarchaeota archaeon]